MESNIKEFKNVYFIPEIKGTILNKKYYEYILLDSNKKRINYKNKNFNINNIENFLKNENIIHINDKCIYIGLHTKHYGHFLIETLSSFWIFLNNNTIENLNDYKYIFTKGRLRNDSIDNLNNGLTRYIFKCFNINYDNVIYIDKVIYKFSNLYIPNKYIHINDINNYNKLHKEVFDKIINYTLSINKQNIEKYDKIFVYRGLKDNRIDLSIENNLVEIFKKYNFKIINPKIETFKNDILCYNNCKIIAGVEGTNIHNILFCKKNTILIGIAGNRQNQFTKTQIACNNIAESINYWIEREMYKDLSIFEEKLKSILLENNLLE